MPIHSSKKEEIKALGGKITIYITSHYYYKVVSDMKAAASEIENPD